MTTLCGPCQAEWMAWLDYKQPVPFLIHSVGKRDPHAQYERWKNTTLSQQKLIEDHCEANHQPK